MWKSSLLTATKIDDTRAMVYRQGRTDLEEVLVTRLIIYGDFNCPFSALASVRADLLLASGGHEIEWRAVQHDAGIPAAGEPVEGDRLGELETEVARIRELSADDVRLELTVPPVRSNTAAASAALAGAGGDAVLLRRRLFAAVWAEGRNLGEPAELARLGATGRDEAVARGWQTEFESLSKPVTPSMVLPDGYVSRGLGALARLADLVAATPSR
jgi:2-hydroxychromene-2-carboxylate isomerase